MLTKVWGMGGEPQRPLLCDTYRPQVKAVHMLSISVIFAVMYNRCGFYAYTFVWFLLRLWNLVLPVKNLMNFHYKKKM